MPTFDNLGLNFRKQVTYLILPTSKYGICEISLRLEIMGSFGSFRKFFGLFWLVPVFFALFDSFWLVWVRFGFVPSFSKYAISKSKKVC